MSAPQLQSSNNNKWQAFISNPIVSEMRQFGRFMLHARPAEIGATTCFAVGIAMIYGGDFIAGGIFLGLSATWAVSAWLLSEKLEKLKPKPLKGKKAKDVERFHRGRKRYLFWRFSVPLLIVAALSLGVYVANGKREQNILNNLQGTLYPGNHPDPPSPCSPAGGETIFHVGAVAARSFVFPIKLVTVGRVPVISLDKNADGSVALIADVKDKDNKLIVRLDKKGYSINRNNYFQMIRKDRSSLIVVDQNGDEVLNAEFLNPKFFKLTGRFYYSGTFIDLNDSAFAAGNLSVSGICMDLMGAPSLGVFGINTR